MKLIGIDLDGTLLNSQQKISETNVQALKNLPKDTFPFICSGREVEDIKNIVRDYDLSIPAIGLNGAIGYDDEKKIFEFSFDSTSVKETDTIISDFPTKVYTNEGSFETTDYKEEMKKIFHKIGSEFSVEELNYELEYEKSIQSTAYETIDEILNNDHINIYKFFVFIPNTQMKKKIKSQLEKVKHITVTESAAVNLEIIPHNVSKGLVYDHLERIYALHNPTRIAIGDSLNDLSLFESADLRFAMKNGHSTIKQLASHITVSNDENGVAEALNKIFSEQKTYKTTSTIDS